MSIQLYSEGNKLTNRAFEAIIKDLERVDEELQRQQSLLPQNIKQKHVSEKHFNYLERNEIERQQKRAEKQKLKNELSQLMTIQRSLVQNYVQVTLEDYQIISHSIYKDCIALLGCSGQKYFFNTIQVQGNTKVQDRFYQLDESFHKIAIINENYVFLIKKDLKQSILIPYSLNGLELDKISIVGYLQYIWALENTNQIIIISSLGDRKIFLFQLNSMTNLIEKSLRLPRFNFADMIIKYDLSTRQLKLSKKDQMSQEFLVDLVKFEYLDSQMPPEAANKFKDLEDQEWRVGDITYKLGKYTINIVNQH